MYVNVESIVLAAEPLSETDKRLSLFTRERGRLFARASGARRPGARLAAATEPAVHARFRLWLPAGGVSARLTGGGLVAGFPGLRSSWTRLTSALFLCEWTDRLTPLAQAHPEKFDLLVGALAALEREDSAKVRLAFLIQFVRLAGYGNGAGATSVADPGPAAAASLGAWNFAGSPPDALTSAQAARGEEHVVQFMAPLFPRPLKSLAHQRALNHYLAKKRVGAESTR